MFNSSRLTELQQSIQTTRSNSVVRKGVDRLGCTLLFGSVNAVATLCELQPKTGLVSPNVVENLQMLQRSGSFNG
jgi:hypothetical protein